MGPLYRLFIGIPIGFVSIFVIFKDFAVRRCISIDIVFLVTELVIEYILTSAKTFMISSEIGKRRAILKNMYRNFIKTLSKFTRVR